jgi:hypothetical protein
VSDVETPPSNETQPRKRRLPTLGCLVVVMLLLVVSAFGLWVASRRNPHLALNMPLIQKFVRLRGQVEAQPVDPEWLHSLVLSTLGEEHAAAFTRVVDINMQDIPIADDLVQDMCDVISLERLNLENTLVTDAALRDVQQLTNLERLILENTRVTDEGLRVIAGMTYLKALRLEETLITDAGLEHLSGMTQLESLSLLDTQVTDEGLQHLSSLVNLQYLHLRGTRVTDAGVEKLQMQLPGVKIDW